MPWLRFTSVGVSQVQTEGLNREPLLGVAGRVKGGRTLKIWRFNKWMFNSEAVMEGVHREVALGPKDWLEEAIQEAISERGPVSGW